MVTRAVAAPRKAWHTVGDRLGRWICLPSSTPNPFNRLFRQAAAVSLLRLRVAPRASDVMLNVSSIGLALRRILRSRLTLIRLALIRKPWSCGEGVSHPPYRYLYLHLLFHALQGGSRSAFNAHGMLPYRRSPVPRLRQTASYPIIIHAGALDQ